MALAVDEACHGGGGTAPLLQLPLLTRLTGWRVVRASCSIDQHPHPGHANLCIFQFTEQSSRFQAALCRR